MHISIKTKNVIVYLIAFFSYLFLFFSVDSFSNDIHSSMVVFFSWLGLLSLIYILYSWKKISGSFFSFQSLFLIFCYLFNFGQCFLWAFGIHSNQEIGASKLYWLFDVSYIDVLKSQLLTIIILFSINLGMLLTYQKRKSSLIKKTFHSKTEINKDVAFILFIFIYIVSLYCAVKDFNVSRNYGYGAIYYGDFAYSTNTILVFFSMMLFASYVSVLLSNKNNHTIITISTIMFLSIDVIQFLSGDRGFVYQIAILLFWFFREKKIHLNVWRIITYFAVGYLAIGLLSSLALIRNGSITLSNLISNMILSENNPIQNALTEMGGSMSPLVALVHVGKNPYPYGNTFLFTIPGMVSERVITFFGIPYESLSNWFSQEFLKLNSGAAFSIVAEIYMNFGEIIGPIFAIFLGLIFGRLFNSNVKNQFDQLLAIIFTIAFIYTARNTFQTGMKYLFWGGFVFCMLLHFLSSLLSENKRMSIKQNSFGRYI